MEEKGTSETRKTTRLIYFVFCRLYPFSPPSQFLGPWHLVLLINTVSTIRACLSLWWERFRWTQKEDNHGPLSIQSSRTKEPFSFNFPSTIHAWLFWDCALNKSLVIHSALALQLPSLILLFLFSFPISIFLHYLLSLSFVSVIQSQSLILSFHSVRDSYIFQSFPPLFALFIRFVFNLPPPPIFFIFFLPSHLCLCISRAIKPFRWCASQAWPSCNVLSWFIPLLSSSLWSPRPSH